VYAYLCYIYLALIVNYHVNCQLVLTYLSKQNCYPLISILKHATKLQYRLIKVQVVFEK